MLLEISFFIQCNRTYLSDFTFVTHQLHIPALIYRDVVMFLLAQLFLHLIFSIGIWFIAIFSGSFLTLSTNQKMIFAIIIWTLGILTVIAANQFYFPNSKFSGLLSIFFPHVALTRIILIGLLLIDCVFVSLALFGFLSKALDKGLLYGMLLIAGLYFTFSHFIPSKPEDASTPERPNVILIGVDSLRPDFLSFFGANTVTPFFDKFLENASVFNQAVTPLARTFPSWTSILTGLYPKEAGIRSNLMPFVKTALSSTLPTLLRQEGYETIYATDETRFSNIDEQYGFDHIVTPPIGLADFLIGTFNDFPLSNLIVNTSLGKWLFPYSYANRPVFHTYDPDTFLNYVEQILSRKRSKPLFLVIHFCLTHYPYLWAELPQEKNTVWERYAKSVVRVDKQINDFFMLLKQDQVLNHAIVVLLSDHGEALAFPEDRITAKELYVANHAKGIPKFYPPSLDNEALNQSAGHGTDVLGLPQYHTLLAFQLYGMTVKHTVGIVSQTISLLTIKPTILELLKLKTGNLSSGVSIARIIEGKINQLRTPLHIFLESDFTPEAIRTVYPEMRSVLLEGVQLFKINPNSTRLTVKKRMREMIIGSKQYADIYDKWIVALYPQDKSERMPILVNLETGEWTNDMQTEFAKRSPVKEMLSALQTFYGLELKGSKS